ncbi:hypothetical protein GCM10027297_21440 [Parahaliea aestuarii]
MSGQGNDGGAGGFGHGNGIIRAGVVDNDNSQSGVATYILHYTADAGGLIERWNQNYSVAGAGNGRRG